MHHIRYYRYFRAVALCLVLLLLLGACGSADPSTAASPVITLPEITPPPVAAESSASEELTTEEPVREESTAEPEPVTIEEHTLLDKDGIRVVFRSFSEDETGSKVEIYVQNGTEKNIALSCISLCVNAYMMPEPAAICLGPDSELNDALFFDRAALDERGIREIGSVYCRMRVIDTDTGETLADPDAYEIRTSAYGRMADTKIWEGRELYDDNGVRILLTDVTRTRTGGTCFKLYVENNSKKDLSLVGLQAVVNGRLADAPYLGVVNADRKALTDLVVSKSFREKYGISDAIDSLELSLEARDGDNWDLLFRTGAIFCDLSGRTPSLSSKEEADTEFVPQKTILGGEAVIISTLGWISAAGHGPGLKLQIVNSSDIDVRFCVDKVIADDYLLSSCGMIVPVAAGKISEAILYLDQDILSLTGNSEFGTVELCCSLQDGATHEVLRTYDPITVETAAKERVEVVSLKGRTIFNEEDLQIVAIAYTGLSETVGERLYLWVKNSSDRTLILEPLYTKVNGSYVLGIGKLTIPPGKMTIGTYTVPARETKRLGVREFRSMVMQTLVYDEAGELQFTVPEGGITVK
ncbi:MAG: hypothetical protein IJK77_01765 [Lachnospiraceae bacterium]|nr:hypothetical protein [Lachnospiraceae bacterium]